MRTWYTLHYKLTKDHTEEMNGFITGLRIADGKLCLYNEYQEDKDFKTDSPIIIKLKDITYLQVE